MGGVSTLLKREFAGPSLSIPGDKDNFQSLHYHDCEFTSMKAPTVPPLLQKSFIGPSFKARERDKF